MKDKHRIYLNIVYGVTFFILYRLGNGYFGTPMKAYNYSIFLTIYLFYYLSNFLDFKYLEGNLKLWISSLIPNFFLAAFLWSFSKSNLLFLKFFILWVGSNILRNSISKLFKRNANVLYIGSQREFENIAKVLRRDEISHKIFIEDEGNRGIFFNEKGFTVIVVELKILEKFGEYFLKLKLERGIKVISSIDYREERAYKIPVTDMSVERFLKGEGFEILSDTIEKKLKRGVDIVIAL